MPRRVKAVEVEDDGGEELTPESVAAMLNKEHGDEAASNGEAIPARDYISTQCAPVDYALGRKGVPVGRITNIYGQEGSSKSTLAYHILAETVARGGIGILYDSEGAWDTERCARLGLDYRKLVFIDAPHFEQASDEFMDILRLSKKKPGKLICAVWDSLAATPTKRELEAKTEELRPGEQARLISQMMRPLNNLVVHTNTALILVNQLRTKINMGGMPVYNTDSIYTQAGEQSIKFYSSVRLNLRQAGKVGDKDEPDGVVIKGQVVKNKLGPGYRRFEFNVMDWDGIDRESAILDIAERIGLVKRNGSWYTFGEQKFQSSKWPEILAANPSIREEVAESPERWITDYQEEADGTSTSPGTGDGLSPEPRTETPFG